MNRRRFARLVVRLGLSFALLLIALATLLYGYGKIDQTQPADVIIVLGAGTDLDGSPGPALTRRTLHAVALYEQGVAPLILCTGGFSEAHPTAEATACARLAETQGVPPEAILVETRSLSTEENAIEAAAVMAERHLGDAVLVSDCFHLARAAWVFRQHGLTVYPSPAQVTTGPLPIADVVIGSLRDGLALIWQIGKTALGLPFTRA